MVLVAALVLVACGDDASKSSPMTTLVSTSDSASDTTLVSRAGWCPAPGGEVFSCLEVAASATIIGRGETLTGTMVYGTLRNGAEVCLQLPDGGLSSRTVVRAIEIDRRIYDELRQGETGSVLVPGGEGVGTARTVLSPGGVCAAR
jgi:translation elongation factor EF-Tu-like GTPase